MDPFRPGWLTGRWGWLILWSGFFFFSVLLILILQLAGVHPWSNSTAERIDSYHHEQCEAVNTSAFFLQVHNFWSNYVYIAAGLLILCLNDSWTGRYIGAVLLFLGFGSAWFHGTLAETGQTVDMMGVYAVLLVMIAYGFIELIPLENDGTAVWVILALATILGLLAGYLRGSLKLFDSDYFTPYLVFFLLCYQGLLRWRYRKAQEPVLAPFLAFLGFGVIALLFKFTDGDKNLLADYGGDYEKCLYGHNSLIQGHAQWHALSAVMFVCIFEYIRSFLARSRTAWPWRLPSQ
jgi:hypothetical protein